ncbi:MAG: carboxypeptidase-like regulatory domain-containing protein, partial [Bacteroidaceae bacterium]|nr:carboxypeptidase-like regulatory domain-containing protein [Bacteroidaceae bacterium]
MRSFWVATLLLFATVVSAQVTTSGMSGKLTDEKKEAIIGAIVQAVHQPSGSRYATVTNTDGRFNIQGMRPGGPYEVQIRYVGFKPKSVKNITLELGETYNMNIIISEDAKQMDELVVVGSSSKFAGEKTGASTNISNAQLESMPTISRSITDITRLSPYGGNGM